MRAPRRGGMQIAGAVREDSSLRRRQSGRPCEGASLRSPHLPVGHHMHQCGASNQRRPEAHLRPCRHHSPEHTSKIHCHVMTHIPFCPAHGTLPSPLPFLHPASPPAHMTAHPIRSQAVSSCAKKKEEAKERRRHNGMGPVTDRKDRQSGAARRTVGAIVDVTKLCAVAASATDDIWHMDGRRESLCTSSSAPCLSEKDAVRGTPLPCRDLPSAPIQPSTHPVRTPICHALC